MRYWLREVRVKSNYTMQDLADKIGVRFQTISSYELGKSNPTTKNAILLGEVLHFDWRKFYIE